MHDPGFDSRHRQYIFCSLKRSHWLWDSSSLLLNGYRLHFLAVKQREREFGYSSPYDVGVKSKWSCASTVPTCPHSMQMDKSALLYILFMYVSMYVCTYVRMYV